MPRIFLISVLLFSVLTTKAQFATSVSQAVRTPQMILNDDWAAPAVIELGSDDVIHFSFDEMSHTYHRYICRISHHNADGSLSELHEIDYLEGFNGFVIDEWENSYNTTQLYTHYSFSLPNDDVSFKVSGNYRAEIFDDNADEDTPVATFNFSIIEPKVSIRATVSGNTDTSFNDNEQQLSFIVNHANSGVVSPANDLIPVIYQNRRHDNKKIGTKPTYMRGNEAEYVHNTELIFEAGNEYRRFELTDPNSPGMNVEDVIFHDSAYHALLYVDKPRVSYANGRDEDGRFYINTLEGRGSPMEADYINVHFAIKMPRRIGGNYHLIGDFCGNKFDKSNILHYDYDEGYYFTSHLLKTGVYNYQYLWVPDSNPKGFSEPAEGSFHNTENEYLIYIYHREFGSRYDKLIGFLAIGNEFE